MGIICPPGDAHLSLLEMIMNMQNVLAESISNATEAIQTLDSFLLSRKNVNDMAAITGDDQDQGKPGLVYAGGCFIYDKSVAGKPKYLLVIGRDYFESDDLESLEKTLYEQWYLRECTDQAKAVLVPTSSQDANAMLCKALEKLIPHVLHYASMLNAHSDAHCDAADARRALANLTHVSVENDTSSEKSVLAGFDDYALIAELSRRGNLVHCWCDDDFEPVLDDDEEVLSLDLTQEQRDSVNHQAFEQASIDLDQIVIARGNEHLSDWWALNKDPILAQFKREQDGNLQSSVI